jgi:hypothetical protein
MQIKAESCARLDYARYVSLLGDGQLVSAVQSAVAVGASKPDFGDNMFKLSLLRTGIVTAVIAIGIAAILAVLVRPFNSYERSAGGLTAHLRVTQAAIVKGRQTMHGGASSGPHEYHIDAAIFDTASATRISDATVTAKVRGLGLLGQETKLEPMNTANGTGYGGFVYLPGIDVFTIELTIERAGPQPPIVFDFTYDHRRQ